MESINVITNRPSLVIILDCWNDYYDLENYNLMLDNIKNFCVSNHNICAVGLSSYHTLKETERTGDANNWWAIGQEEPWHSNSKNMFYNTTAWQTLRNLWKSTTFHNYNSTHPVIKDMLLNDNVIKLLLWHNLQILYYCNYVNTSIENIYIFGMSWDMCFKGRPAGWSELSCLNKYNLFSTPKTILTNRNCVLTSNKTFLSNVPDPWIAVDSNLMMLDHSKLNH